MPPSRMSSGSLDHTDLVIDQSSLTEWFHSPPQINIGGSARVHLGDQYNDGSLLVARRSRTTEGKTYKNLATVGAAIDLVEYSMTTLSKREASEGDEVEPLHFHLACNTLESSRDLLQTYLESIEGATGPGEMILAEVLTGCINVANGLKSALEGIFNAAVGTRFPSLRHIILRACSEEQIFDMLTFLGCVCEKALVALLILMRSELTLGPPFSLGASRSTDRILLETIRRLHEAHTPAIDDLYRSTTGWFGSLWSDKSKSAALTWLSAQSHLLADYRSIILQKLAAERTHTVRLRVLSSLCFSEMERRYHAITPAQSRTLGWLFNDSDTAETLKYNFARWLRASDPATPQMYWIRGKPGSGKSTLMRYLLDDPRTRRLVETWAGGNNYLVVSCFFWGSGTELQKSQNGLLQTLLHQLLTARNDFPRLLFPSRWDLLELGTNFDQSWHANELRDVIFKFVKYYCNPLKIFILVDGLDEYQGNDEQRQDICMLLNDLSQQSNVKVCVSSRPWNVYRDAFHRCPKLGLELLTKQDIRNFIEDAFNSNEHYCRWSRLEPRAAQHMVTTLVSRAAGVFLWVRLVVKSILMGLRDGDDAYELSRRIDDIPSDLEALFRHMLSRLEPFYLESASKTFELAMLQEGQGHLVIVYYYIHEGRSVASSAASARMLSTHDVLQRQEIEERRINAQCMGLLEFLPVDEGRMRPFHTVEFLHRTARDFMASGSVRRILLSWREPSWNPHLALFVSHVRLLQSVNPDAPWMHISLQFGYITSMLRQLAAMAHPHGVFDLLAAAEDHFNALIDAARKLSLWIGHGDVNSFFGLLDRDFTDFLGLAIQEGATSYALSRLPSVNLSDLRRKHGRPLLDFTLNSRSAKSTAPSLALTAGLLTLGANPNDFLGPFHRLG